MCLILAGCTGTNAPAIRIGDHTVENANTRADRIALRDRWSATSGKGALLVFPVARRLALPVTDMAAPANVAFIRADGSISAIVEHRTTDVPDYRDRLYAEEDVRAILILPANTTFSSSDSVDVALLTESAEDYPVVTFPDGQTAWVEIARTPPQRQQGLMWRENLSIDTGMLFVFDQDRTRSFWMRNTRTPLSIAYIKSDGMIATIFDMEPLSEAGVPSIAAVKYCLEMKRGWFAERGIEPGTTVTLPPESILQTDQ
jgi:uncharacterized membrane protein (UPF0127 family)